MVISDADIFFFCYDAVKIGRDLLLACENVEAEKSSRSSQSSPMTPMHMKVAQFAPVSQKHFLANI